MNGTRAVAYMGTTASKEGEDSLYNKVGNYQDRWQEPMTIYFEGQLSTVVEATSGRLIRGGL